MQWRRNYGQDKLLPIMSIVNFEFYLLHMTSIRVHDHCQVLRILLNLIEIYDSSKNGLTMTKLELAL